MPTPHPGGICTISLGKMRSRLRLLSSAIIPVWLACCPSQAFAGDKGYLDALESEARKVETRQTGQRADESDPDSASTQLPLPETASVKPGMNRHEFESMLEQRYRGTYTFYSKLSQRSQDEIYDNYGQGMDVDKLKEKVLKRFRHENP